MSEFRRNWWLGLVVIALGIFLLLGNLGIADLNAGELVFKYWPLLLVILGVRALQQKKGSAYLSGGILIALGFLLLGKKLGFIQFDYALLWKAFWPVIFILLGISFLRGPKWQEKSNWAFMGDLMHQLPVEAGKPELLGFMGGITLDLRQAQIELGNYF